MQTYSEVFARVYNLRWAGFARWIAPKIVDFYTSTPMGGPDSRSRASRRILDLCCGTGQLAVYLLEHGYQVVGLDASGHMLHHATENTLEYIKGGQARFILADASDFALDERFGLVISTYDALNHLESEDALKRCFQCVFAVLEEDGYFVFDLNTRAGLKRWTTVRVDDDEEAMIVSRGVFVEESDRAYTFISGFIQTEGSLYERFEETVYNTVFDMASVRQSLLEIGWRGVHFARIEALASPIEEPEGESRVFLVAHK